MAKKEIGASELLDEIIALTFTRHANLDEAEFIKALGITEPKDEDTEVRNARFALISASTKELLRAINKLKLITQIIMLSCDVTEEQLKEREGK